MNSCCIVSIRTQLRWTRLLIREVIQYKFSTHQTKHVECFRGVDWIERDEYDGLSRHRFTWAMYSLFATGFEQIMHGLVSFEVAIDSQHICTCLIYCASSMNLKHTMHFWPPAEFEVSVVCRSSLPSLIVLSRQLKWQNQFWIYITISAFPLTTHPVECKLTRLDWEFRVQ